MTPIDDLGRIAAAADLLTGYRFECWHYGDSVGFEGLLAGSDLLGAPRYEGFVHGALKAWAPRATPYRELDNTAPGHAMCLCYERTQDVGVLDAAARLADFLRARETLAGVYVPFKQAPLRVPYGDTQLNEDEAALLRDPGPGIFVDCVHFDGPFFAHLGAITGDRELADIAAEQALAAIALLQDPETGIFSHFWLEKTGETYGYGWGRGQGWALLGLLDVLDYLPQSHPSREPIRDALLRTATALASTQDASGHWPALVQEPTSYLETSTSLFVAAGFARGISSGTLGSDLTETRDRAWQAGLRAVDVHGLVQGVSAVVWASTALGHYRSVPSGFLVPWGQGPLLLAAKAMADAAGGTTANRGNSTAIREAKK